MKNHLANFTTLLNMFCGIAAIWLAMHGHIEWACYAVIAGAVFDFFDGLVARALKTSTELGKQLDSLSDVVTFGAAPSLMLAFIVEKILLEKGMADTLTLLIAVSPLFLNTLFAGLRLAKFNLDTRQSENFIGLPSPANGIFFISLAWLIATNQEVYIFMSQHYYLFYVFSILFSFLMVSEFPLFGFKVKQYQWKGNEPKIIFLLVCISIVLLSGISGLSLCIILYIITSIVAKKYFV
jgi:CDP-diacylglycerol---serine O-phosphatidyltransferase